MSNLEHKTTRELIDTVDSQNRKFRVAGVIFGAVTIIGLVIVVLICLSTLAGVKNQLEQQKQLLETQNQTLKAISDQGDKRTEQLAQISKQIDCIAQFFTQRNRQNVVIKDLEQCKILNADGTTTSGTTFSGNNDTPRSQEQANINPNMPGLSPVTPSRPDTPDQPEESFVHRIPVLGGLLKRIGL